MSAQKTGHHSHSIRAMFMSRTYETTRSLRAPEKELHALVASIMESLRAYRSAKAIAEQILTNRVPVVTVRPISRGGLRLVASEHAPPASPRVVGSATPRADTMKDSWVQLKEAVLETWTELTQDLESTDDERAQLLATLQEKYGKALEVVELEISRLEAERSVR